MGVFTVNGGYVDGCVASDRDLKLIDGGDGLRARRIGDAVVVLGPCGQRHTMSLAAGRALADWLNRNCRVAQDADFTIIDGDAFNVGEQRKSHLV